MEVGLPGALRTLVTLMALFEACPLIRSHARVLQSSWRPRLRSLNHCSNRLWVVKGWSRSLR